jgi:hypothetical protein
VDRAPADHRQGRRPGAAQARQEAGDRQGVGRRHPARADRSAAHDRQGRAVQRAPDRPRRGLHRRRRVARPGPGDDQGLHVDQAAHRRRRSRPGLPRRPGPRRSVRDRHGPAGRWGRADRPRRGRSPGGPRRHALGHGAAAVGPGRAVGRDLAGRRDPRRPPRSRSAEPSTPRPWPGRSGSAACGPSTPISATASWWSRPMAAGSRSKAASSTAAWRSAAGSRPLPPIAST